MRESKTDLYRLSVQDVVSLFHYPITEKFQKLLEIHVKKGKNMQGRRLQIRRESLHQS